MTRYPKLKVDGVSKYFGSGLTRSKPLITSRSRSEKMSSSRSSVRRVAARALFSRSLRACRLAKRVSSSLITYRSTVPAAIAASSFKATR